MQLIIYKILAILLSGLIFAQAFLIKRTLGTYIFPAALMALAWFFFTFVPMLAFYDMPINPLPILYIFICVLAFSLSALPFNWSRAFSENKLKDSKNSIRFDSKFLLAVFLISATLSIIISTLTMMLAGIELKSIIFDLLKTSGQFSSMRFAGQLRYGILEILSIFFTYLTPILGGIVTYNLKNKTQKIFFTAITFLPSLYVMMVQSSKIIVFYTLGFYLAGFLLRKICSNNLDLFNRKVIMKTIIAVLIIFPLMILSISARSDFAHANDIIKVALNSVKSYAFGQTYAFSDFFMFYLGKSSLNTYVNDLNSYGRYTFTSIYNLLGGTKGFPPGTYVDYYIYNKVPITNIYTIFRSLINDFGAIGTVIFMFISGLIVHVFFYLLLKARASYIASAAFVITVVYIEGTYLASIFMARYMYLLCVAVAVILWANDFLNRYISNDNSET